MSTLFNFVILLLLPTFSASKFVLGVVTGINGENVQISARFEPERVRMTMDNSTLVNYTIAIDKTAIPEQVRSIQLDFGLVTSSPQFDIIEFYDNKTGDEQGVKKLNQSIILSIERLNKDNFVQKSTLHLKSTYIGHAFIELRAQSLNQDGSNSSLTIAVAPHDGDVIRGKYAHSGRVAIISTRNEGILDKIFMYSVIIFITISYINLGAQIDLDNVKRLIETPKVIFVGYLIGITVMPVSSWLAGQWFFEDQPMYRIGSFIYACAPAASASVLWTVMFDADKELALGLQISSTIGALTTMPILLYAMDKSIDLEGQYTIKVPYMNLARTLIVLLIALMIGSRLVGRSKRAKQMSQRVFRPLTMFVLLFIIVFSSIVYWYIYKMFNLKITLMALVVTCVTYILSGLLGYMIKRDIDHMITISISSTYRNSGIAFAALVVAFQPPDIFIAYVPCLTQVVTTSLIGLAIYSIKSLKKHCVK